jgi:hypothetical protein
MSKFIWNCVTCMGSGSISNPNVLPITTLVNRAALEHLENNPDCQTAKEADVKFVPYGCVFTPMPPRAETPVQRGTDPTFMSLLATRPRTIGPSIHRLGGLTLSELHDNTGLPGCFIEELLMNDFKPDTSWAKDLAVWQGRKQVLYALQPFETIAHEQAKVNVCYHTSIQFYEFAPEFRNIELVNLEPRTWPRTSFIERFGELWEVTTGNVRFVAGKWRWRWRCYRNTELARHFRGAHGSDCIPCRQIEFIREYGHGNYGTCADCKGVFCLCPDQKLGPVIPRHACIKGIVRPGWWPEKILEPVEAKGLVREL